MQQLILCLKTASKTTRLSVHSNREQIFMNTVRHSSEELSQFNFPREQYDLRKKAVLDELKKANIYLNEIGIIVCKGGVIKPMPGGIYRVNDAMLEDILHPMAEHESNLAALIAEDIAKQSTQDIQAVIADPACVDEMDELAKLSGLPEITRRSLMHTLSQRTAAKNYAKSIGKSYDSANVIVAHLGSGISVGAHCNGKIIDVNNGLNGDGPMSPARTGSLPVGQLIDLCYSGKYTKEEMMLKIYRDGGMKAYLGTSDAIAVEKRVLAGDKEAILIFNAIAYQVAKEIGSLTTVLAGEVDGIVITGGLAHSQFIINEIIKRVKHLGNVTTYPGENEMSALAANGFMVLSGEIIVKEYA